MINFVFKFLSFDKNSPIISLSKPLKIKIYSANSSSFILFSLKFEKSFSIFDFMLFLLNGFKLLFF